MEQTPIVGTIVVTQQTARGILTEVNGETQVFPDLPSVFRAAIRRLDEQNGQFPPNQKEGA